MASLAELSGKELATRLLLSSHLHPVLKQAYGHILNDTVAVYSPPWLQIPKSKCEGVVGRGWGGGTTWVRVIKADLTE